ncbi:hypothetical protein E2562_010214 [Oryza meyeriana var. granulata]|uniref:Uncharacterized protein n=1 Tax=Oryza meyeriana var. granulata TaxID=110450 RepID=A0A6G1EIN0_9ORYZ|nr:hypothetical protein E2562_010214 [Oryza meyeriana var. granulata]
MGMRGGVVEEQARELQDEVMGLLFRVWTEEEALHRRAATLKAELARLPKHLERRRAIGACGRAPDLAVTTSRNQTPVLVSPFHFPLAKTYSVGR